jgi:hypothetical protein
LEVNRRFGGTYRLYLEGRRISETRNQHEVASRLVFFLTYYLSLKVDVAPKRRLIFNELHSILYAVNWHEGEREDFLPQFLSLMMEQIRATENMKKKQELEKLRIWLKTERKRTSK